MKSCEWSHSGETTLTYHITLSMTTKTFFLSAGFLPRKGFNIHFWQRKRATFDLLPDLPEISRRPLLFVVPATAKEIEEESIVSGAGRFTSASHFLSKKSHVGQLEVD